MATAHDIAAYILSKTGPVSAMKLQKLVYYSQAWSLVWTEEPLFQERIEAWANGPVVPDLYARHRGQFLIARWDGHPGTLTAGQKDTIERVLAFYGDKSPRWLSDRTHKEAPWCLARGGLAHRARSDAEITLESMHRYYSSITP